MTQPFLTYRELEIEVLNVLTTTSLATFLSKPPEIQQHVINMVLGTNDDLFLGVENSDPAMHNKIKKGIETINQKNLLPLFWYEFKKQH